MGKIMKWKEIISKHPDEWVALINFCEDPDFKTKSQGEIYASSKSRKELSELIKKKGEVKELAITFTGDRMLKGFNGGIWPEVNQ